MKKKISIPKFANENEERRFWSKMDLEKYFDLEDFRAVSFPNLKPTSRAISIRLPEAFILRLKEQANELQIPYQALIKQYIAEGLRKKQKKAA